MASTFSSTFLTEMLISVLIPIPPTSTCSSAATDLRHGSRRPVVADWNTASASVVQSIADFGIGMIDIVVTANLTSVLLIGFARHVPRAAPVREHYPRWRFSIIVFNASSTSSDKIPALPGSL